MKEKHTPEPIGTALAIVSKLTTSVDGGFKLTLDIPGTDNEELSSKLLQLALNPEEIFVTFVKRKK